MSKRDFTKFPEPIFYTEKNREGETVLGNIRFSDDAESCRYISSQPVVDDVITVPDGINIVRHIIHPRITAVAIPSSVHTIGYYAFTVLYGHTTYEGYYTPEMDDPIGNDLHKRLKTVILSEGLRTIKERAFACMMALTGIKLPKGLECIEEEAFMSCHGLNEIIIPASVRTLEFGAFSNCSGIKKAIFFDGIETLPPNLFYKNTSLTELKLPQTLKRIDEYSFSCCKSLPEVDLPDSVTEICGGAFYGCNSLTEFTFKHDITMGEGVFTNCENLTSFNIQADVKHPELLPYAPHLQSITTAKHHPDFITIDGAVYTKDKKTLVRVPHGICGGFTVPRGVTAIGNRAFAECRGITSVDLPSTVESIGEKAFYGCTAIENITLGGKVKTVGDYAFAKCEKLNSLHVSQSVTKIGEGILLECGEMEITVSPGNPVYKTENGVIVKK